MGQAAFHERPRHGVEPEWGFRRILEYHSLKRKDDYIRLDRDDVEFSKDQKSRILEIGRRNGTQPPNTVYTFGTYWIDKDRREARIGDVKGREKVRYLYTFEVIEKGKHVRAVKRRRYYVTIDAND